MVAYYFYLLFLLWSFGRASNEITETSEPQQDAYPTMAPNSKFLNPHVDDATNLQFAIAAFADESKGTERNKSKASEVLAKLSESLIGAASKTPVKDSREPRSMRNWRLLPILQAVVTGNKDYKFKSY